MLPKIFSYYSTHGLTEGNVTCRSEGIPYPQRHLELSIECVQQWMLRLSLCCLPILFGHDCIGPLSAQACNHPRVRVFLGHIAWHPAVNGGSTGVCTGSQQSIHHLYRAAPVSSHV